MRSQFVKDLYYASVGKLTYFSYLWSSLRSSSYRNKFVNIGCGPDYVEGMINVDGNLFRRKEIWLDVNFGLPFASDSIAGVYSSHTVEHFDVDHCRALLSECCRVLKPGCTMRIVVPSLEFAIGAYTENRPGDLPDWPEKYRSIGGRFSNFLLVANQHFLLLDFTFLEELLLDAGFSEVVRGSARKSSHFSQDHMQFEFKGEPDTSLYVEAKKL